MEKALIEEKIYKEEKRFSINDYNGDSSLPMYEFIKGDIPFIVTAPHTVWTYQRKTPDERKKPEKFTGTMAILLHELTGCWVMFRNNYPYKQYVSPIEGYNKLLNVIEDYKIQSLADLHGMNKRRIPDICPGLGNGYLVDYDFKIKDLITKSFNVNQEFLIDFDSDFQGFNPFTICRNVKDKTGIPVAQFEFNERVRDPENEIEKYLNSLYAMKSYINMSLEYFKAKPYTFGLKK